MLLYDHHYLHFFLVGYCGYSEIISRQKKKNLWQKINVTINLFSWPMVVGFNHFENHNFTVATCFHLMTYCFMMRTCHEQCHTIKVPLSIYFIHTNLCHIYTYCLWRFLLHFMCQALYFVVSYLYPFIFLVMSFLLGLFILYKKKGTINARWTYHCHLNSFRSFTSPSKFTVSGDK
jgi:hypothetical protein